MAIINSKLILSDPGHFLAFGLGSGLAKWFPGTCGTVAAIPFYLFLAPLSWPVYLTVLIATFAFGVWICDRAEKAVGIPDYRGIVWDEMVGYWCTMFLVPTGWLWMLAGFVLFRFFDIAKPWPISWFNRRVKGGFGVMLDDVVAALFAWGLLQIARYFMGI